MISLEEYLILSALLFCISIAGIIISRKNILILLMAIELLLLSINTNFLVFSHFNDNIDGHIFVLFILAIAAAESAIGLAIIVSIFKSMNSLSINIINRLKG